MSVSQSADSLLREKQDVAMLRLFSRDPGLNFYRDRGLKPEKHVAHSFHHSSRRNFSVLLKRANAIKLRDNAIKMPDQHKYE